MNARRRWVAVIGVMMAFAMVVAACGDDDAAESTTTTAAPATTAEATTTTAAPTTTAPPETTQAASDIAFGRGVTLEPCPDSQNPDNGCIYLGVISDFSGPFAAFGLPLTWGKEDFWARVNANGGIMGFDVAITPENTYDAGYVAENHVAGYQQIRGNVAALAESLGTLQTLAAIPLMIEDSMVSPVSSWYSGWSFDDIDGGLIVEAGTNYCFEAMNGFDFVMNARSQIEGGIPFTYAIVGFPGDYGGDYAAGVKIAAAAYDMGDPVFEFTQLPISVGGTVDEAVAGILQAQPDVVFVTTGPTELGQIMGGVAGNGYLGAMYVGTGPTWHPALLGASEGALVPLLEQAYFQTSQNAGFNDDTAGHIAMREAFEANGRANPNLGYVAGWVMSYNMYAVLEQAIMNKDLTPEGIAAAVSQVTVDYEGMLPDRQFGDPNDTVERGAVVHRIDATAPDGLAVIAPFFTGPTAVAYEFNAPCLVLGG